MARNLGIYVHIPFCASACDYCAFYKAIPRRQDILVFLEVLQREWEMRYGGEPLDTIFFGGGTPGILPPQDFQNIAHFLLPDGSNVQEWTVEFSPSTVKRDKLLALKALGVTRISLGVQSFDPQILKTLGRKYSISQAEIAIQTIQEVGFDLNLDLIFHVPGQTLHQWSEDLEKAMAFQPSHISTYCLTYEGQTPLVERFGGTRHSSPESGSKFYLQTWKQLREAGYGHYEVSNFARPGKECRHHLNTWRMGNWLGIGPSAASQYGGRRFTNVSDLGRWREGICNGRPIEENGMEVTQMILLQDYMIFGLRLREGISGVKMRADWGEKWADYESFFDRLCESKLMMRQNDDYALTDRGLLLVDRIGAEILEIGGNNA